MIADNIRVKIQQSNDLGLEIKSKIQGSKLIVNAYSLNDKIEYQGELQPHPYIDFQGIQELLNLNKSIKIVTQNMTFLKIKVGATPIQLVSKYKKKIDLQNLSQTFEKAMKNQSLMEKQMKEQKQELNEQKNLIFGLKKQIEEMKLSQQEKDFKFLRFQQAFIVEKQKLRDEINQSLDEMLKIKQEIRSQIEKIKLQPEFYENLIKELKTQINGLKLESQITLTTVCQQSEQLKQHEAQLKLLESYLQSKLKSPLQILQFSLFQSRLNKTIRSCKWSEQLKSKQLTIKNNVVTKTIKQNEYSQFCLLNASFSNKLKHKQSWTIKINKITAWIGLGVCLKSKMTKYNFNDQNIKWRETGHGLYMIGPGGHCYSHSQKEFNCVKKSFKFYEGDVIDVEYDPIERNLRFSKKKGENYFEMPIIEPPQNDAYHPFVTLFIQNDSVQLLSPPN